MGCILWIIRIMVNHALDQCLWFDLKKKKLGLIENDNTAIALVLPIW